MYGRAHCKMDTYGSLLVISILLAVLTGYAVQKYFMQLTKDSEVVTAMQKLGKDGMSLFQKFDENHDMCIDPHEFLHLFKLILSMQDQDEKLPEGGGHEEYNPETDEVVRLEAEMEPLVLSTMSQKKKDSSFGLPGFTYSPEFSGLLHWKKVYRPKLEMLAKEFHVFLPPNKLQELGKPYWFLPKPDFVDESLSQNLYRSSSPTSNVEKVLYKLLSMFHPRPFVMMRFSPQGGVASVRARNKVYLDIQFRIHCEFQLNEYPRHPFWFTPAQFEGRLVVARDASHVREFSLRVPADAKLNVDMEWEVESEDGLDSSMEVDIGYIPLLSIKQPTPSSPAVLNDGSGTVIDRRELWKNGQDIALEFDRIAWNEEISVTEAKRKIEIMFYPFKEVEYHPFGGAFELASAEQKLVHQIVLWGALDDQSC